LGRGAFRRLKDVLAEVGLLDEWYEIDGDSKRGRARRWLSDEGYTPDVQDGRPLLSPRRVARGTERSLEA
jgi:hypothetical protein